MFKNRPPLYEGGISYCSKDNRNNHAMGDLDESIGIFTSKRTLSKQGKSSSNKSTVKKCILIVICLILVVSLVIYEFISSFDIKVQLKDLEAKVEKVEYKLDHLNEEYQKSNAAVAASRNKQAATDTSRPFLKSERNPEAPFVAINLCGDGYQKVKSSKGEPYNEWKQTIKSGDIEYDKRNGHIKIKTAGIYFVYAQMYLFKNSETTAQTLDFQIKRNYDVLSYASTPKSACPLYCTKYTSKIVSLKIGDHLYVTSHNIGVQFFMACDKAQFGLSMLKKG